ncbi:hypothetical protein [Psychroserpens sp.]|uniref:hypothetical protein n=1 Tax=Psychroserpens sp. TaxID=2020870 RepID=UPI001AFFCEE9|nr:hypothetical protein [Psychroserpens sp.]MBO6607988.1 hypothetical protein [Psychroserpens sp.]MBO6631806.1 hypothetical protein [Psychroserpens sp.]MBO6654885.1 hypothetical protein [Psychroserpens sp.]MBO6683041.1 hypothetical protein [Psychroserpens sp.]MBO6751346.1 hypothetical protein [Psychroserpens sp.]
MIKKLLCLSLILFYTFGYAQNSSEGNEDCIRNFEIIATSVNGSNPRVDDIRISWNFSNDTEVDNLKLILKVQPLNACWDGLSGIDRSELRSYSFNDLSEATNNHALLEFRNIDSKCIKWKVIIIDAANNCETKTEWQFKSFI